MALHKPTSRQAVSDSSSTLDADNIQYNIQLLTHDLLYVLELVHAMSAGDFAQIEDILGNLAMVFRGASSNNYCSEILHFLYNLKKVWTPEFVDITCDNMLVNLMGIKGHCMPIDLNIGHLIKFLKVRLSCKFFPSSNLHHWQHFFAAKGVYTSWDHLGDILATVYLLQSVCKQVGCALGIVYHGISHTMPDMSAAINKVAYKVEELELHIFNLNRPGGDLIRPVVDMLTLSNWIGAAWGLVSRVSFCCLPVYQQ